MSIWDIVPQGDVWATNGSAKALMIWLVVLADAFVMNVWTPLENWRLVRDIRRHKRPL